MRYHLLAGLAAVFVSAGVASAQPRDAKPTGPAVELRVQSVNALVEKLEYVAGLAGNEEDIKNLRESLKMLTQEGKGLAGIDPAKPVGAYATLDKDIASSQIVILIPVADQEHLLKALKGLLNLELEEQKDGTYTVAVQLGQIEKLHLRFSDGYVYVSNAPKSLDPKTLIPPKTFFANPDGSVLSLVVHIDRIPDELKALVLTELEKGLEKERQKQTANDAEKHLKKFVLDLVENTLKGLIGDGRELSLKVFVEPKTDELSAEITLSAKSGSPLAKYIASVGKNPSLPASIVRAAGAPVAQLQLNLAVPDGVKKDYLAAVDAILAELQKKAPPDFEVEVKKLLAAVEPTLKGGVLDASFALVGPDDKGHYQLVLAAGLKEGKKLDEFVRDFVKQFGPFIENAVTFKLDEDKIGAFKLHRIDVAEIDEGFEKVFGKATIWLAISDDCVALSIEPEGKLIRKGLKAKPVSVPAASLEISAAKLLPLVKPDLKPDELKALLKDAFGDGPRDGKDTIAFTVTGGDKLTITLKLKGIAVRLLTGADLLKGK